MIENICHLEAGVNDASTPFPQSFLFLVRPFLLDRQSANNMLGAIAEEEEAVADFPCSVIRRGATNPAICGQLSAKRRSR